MLRDRPREFLYAEEAALVNQHPEAAMRSLSGHRPMGVNTVSYFGNTPGKGHELWTGEKFDNSVPGGARSFPERKVDKDLLFITNYTNVSYYSDDDLAKGAQYLSKFITNSDLDPKLQYDLNQMLIAAGQNPQTLRDWEQAFANIYSNKGNGDLNKSLSLWSDWISAYGSATSPPDALGLIGDWCAEVALTNGAHIDEQWLTTIPTSSPSWAPLTAGWNDWGNSKRNFDALLANAQGVTALQQVNSYVTGSTAWPIVQIPGGPLYQPGIDEQHVTPSSDQAYMNARLMENYTQAMAVAQVNSLYTQIVTGTPVTPSEWPVFIGIGVVAVAVGWYLTS